MHSDTSSELLFIPPRSITFENLSFFFLSQQSELSFMSSSHVLIYTSASFHDSESPITVRQSIQNLFTVISSVSLLHSCVTPYRPSCTVLILFWLLMLLTTELLLICLLFSVCEVSLRCPSISSVWSVKPASCPTSQFFLPLCHSHMILFHALPQFCLCCNAYNILTIW